MGVMCMEMENRQTFIDNIYKLDYHDCMGGSAR